MRFFQVLAVLLIVCPGYASAGERYELGDYYLVRSTYETDLIEGFDIQKYGAVHLSSFTIKRQSDYIGYWIPFFTFFNDNDVFVDIQVSLFPNVSTAETTALEFLNNGNLRSEYGPFKDFLCGDNFWWYASDDNLWYVIFVRKNAVVRVSTSYIEERRYDDIMSLAKQIDNDLLNGAPYVIMSDNIRVPEITGVDVAESSLKLGDTASIEVSAYDPQNTELLYKGDWFKGPVDGENNKLQFRVTEVSVPLGEPFEGDHTYSVWVVNELNMHSYKYPVKLSF